MSRNRKKKPSKPYRGYCTFPLVGADTYREFQATSEMFGDFADPVKRKRIFILYEVAMQGLRELDGQEEVDGEQSIIKIII